MAFSKLRVEEDSSDSDHFPVVISVAFHLSSIPGPTLYNWSPSLRRLILNFSWFPIPISLFFILWFRRLCLSIGLSGLDS